MDPLDKIADAVDVKKDVLEIKADLSGLSAHLRSHLAQQTILNERLDRQLGELTSQTANMRERLVRVEEISCRVPGVEARVGLLENKLAKYVGICVGAAILVNLLWNFAVNTFGKILGG